MSDLTPLQSGQIRFLDNGVPALGAGTYNISVTHQITDPSLNVDGSYTASQQFIVQAPRFSLPAGEVLSRFPAPGNESDFHEYMPFMVFSEKHLLWARTLTGTTDTGFAPPWMALMLFEASDLQYTKPTPPQQPNPTLATVRPITEIANVNANNVLGPVLNIAPYETSLQASSIDILGTTFQALAPTFNDLPFLAHLRQINTGGQTISGMDEDGYYPVLLANRLPDPTKVTPYIVHLVSLEGWEDYLPGGTKQFAANQVARLVSLDSWNFTSDPAGGDFAGLVNGLSIGGLQLPFNPPLSWGTNPAAYTPAQTEASNRYSNGYVALNATTRLGQNSFSWYRGPLTPVVPTMIQNTEPTFTQNSTPLGTSDQALIYDPVNGMFDVSYAIAFELGRLLTLANRPAALAIWAWKKEGIRLLQILNNIILNAQQGITSTPLSARQPAAYGAEPTPIDWQQTKQDLQNPHAGPQKFMDCLTTSLAPHFKVGTQASQSNFVQLRNPSGLHQHLDSMPGLLTPEELQGVLSSGQDPHAYISQKLNTTSN